MATIRFFDRNLRGGGDYLFRQTNQMENCFGLQQNFLPKKIHSNKTYFFLHSVMFRTGGETTIHFQSTDIFFEDHSLKVDLTFFLPPDSEILNNFYRGLKLRRVHKKCSQ